MHCKRSTPNTNNQYNCCTNINVPDGGETCGMDWYYGSDACVKYMQAHCAQGNNPITDAQCNKGPYTFRTDNVLATLCKQHDNFETKPCKDFCESAFTNNNNYFGGCIQTAQEICTSNPSDPRCACFNAPDTKEFQKFSKIFEDGKLPKELGNYQCYWKDCINANQFSDTFRQPSDALTPPCPSAVCIQSLNMSGITADSIGKITQACNIKTDPDTPPSDPDTPPSDPDTPPSDPDTPPSDPDTPPSDPDTPPSKFNKTYVWILLFLAFITIGIFLYYNI
jgi:hypothetical protein